MEDVVKILNLKQIVFYIAHGFQPKRVELTARGKLIFVFPREETQAVYSEWIQKCYGETKKGAKS